MSDVSREIIRDEVYQIVDQNNLFISKFLSRDLRLSLEVPTLHDPETPVIVFTQPRDFCRTTLNEIDHVARFILIFGFSNISLIVTHSNNCNVLGELAYEDPKLFENLSKLLFEKCKLEVVLNNLDDANDGESKRKTS